MTVFGIAVIRRQENSIKKKAEDTKYKVLKPR